MSGGRRKGRPRRSRRKEGRPKLEVGRVLGTSLSIWGRNAGPIVVLALMVMLPQGIALCWFRFTSIGIEGSRVLFTGGPEYLVRLLMGAVLTATLIGYVLPQLHGERPRIGRALSSAFARLPVVLAVAILQVLMYTACVALPMLIASEAPVPLFLLSVLLGAIAVGVVYCGLCVAVPTAVAERPGVIGAIRRSWKLTRGSRWRICVAILLFLILSLLVSTVARDIEAGSGGQGWFWVWAYAMPAVVASLEAVFLAVLYHELRVTVDEVTGEDVTEVFR